VVHKIVTKSGAWFKYGEEQLGQGREKTKQYLKENPKFMEKLKADIVRAFHEGGSEIFAGGGSSGGGDQESCGGEEQPE
jgi:recombination protein RecA